MERSRTKADAERSSSLFPHNPSDPKKAKSLRQTCLAFSYLKEISRAKSSLWRPKAFRVGTRLFLGSRKWKHLEKLLLKGRGEFFETPIFIFDCFFQYPLANMMSVDFLRPRLTPRWLAGNTNCQAHSRSACGLSIPKIQSENATASFF